MPILQRHMPLTNEKIQQFNATHYSTGNLVIWTMEYIAPREETTGAFEFVTNCTGQS